ncbi:MAG: GNAT family N-acetyltransferase [Solirubrobacteraceae bacterium]
MTTEVDIIHQPERDRFTITVDGAEAGFAKYRERPGEIAFMHTETDPAQQGRGLASILIAHALQDARRRNLTVLPYCSFVRDYIARHREYVELVPEVRRARFGL